MLSQEEALCHPPSRPPRPQTAILSWIQANCTAPEAKLPQYYPRLSAKAHQLKSTPFAIAAKVVKGGR